MNLSVLFFHQRVCSCLWLCVAGQKDVRVTKERAGASSGALGRSWKVLSRGWVSDTARHSTTQYVDLNLKHFCERKYSISLDQVVRIVSFQLCFPTVQLFLLVRPGDEMEWGTLRAIVVSSNPFPPIRCRCCAYCRHGTQSMTCC